MYVLVVFAFGTSLYAKHQVLGQSPRSAKVFNTNAITHIVLGQSPRNAKVYNTNAITHIVLGQSPRNAKVYNEKALLSENGMVRKPVLAIFNEKDK
jgi:hypothetical protein